MIPTEADVRQLADNLLNLVVADLMEGSPVFLRWVDKQPRAKWGARLDELRDRMIEAMRRRWAVREE